jgi:hypothetical protein
MSTKTAEQLQAKLQTSLSKLVGLVGKIQIGVDSEPC